MNNPENKDIFMSVQLLSDETEESVIGISKKKNQYDDLPKYSSTKTCLHHYLQSSSNLDMERNFTRPGSPVPSEISMMSNKSMDPPSKFEGELDPTSRRLVEKLREECRQIKAGSPVRYQLQTEKEYVNKEKNVRRWTFGKRDNSKKNQTIMLVGETGTGKTTLINSLINYLLGVKKEDNVWFEISEETAGDQTKSQTQCLTVYEVFIEACPNSFSILDTPGFGDTEAGLAGDEMIADRLYTLFSSYDGMYSIDAIGLVLKASLGCLHDRQLYMFDAIQSLFGKNVQENIVVFITHADERFYHNVFAAIDKSKISLARNEQSQPTHFLFDNFQSDSKQAGNDSAYNTKWDLGKRSTELFIKSLNCMKTQSLKITETVLEDRQKLKKFLRMIKESTAQTDSKEQKLKKIKTDMEEMEQNEDFRVEKCDKEKVNIPQTSWWRANEATCCKVCEENCHLECWGITDLSWCKVMSNNRCTKCTGRCPTDDHVKEKKMYKVKRQKVTKINDQYIEEYTRQENMYKQVEDELRKEKENKSKLLDETYNHIINLEEIALKKISVFTLVHLDYLIERMNEMQTYKTEKVIKLEELMKSWTDDNTQKALKYYRCMKPEETGTVNAQIILKM